MYRSLNRRKHTLYQTIALRANFHQVDLKRVMRGHPWNLCFWCGIVGICVFSAGGHVAENAGRLCGRNRLQPGGQSKSLIRLLQMKSDPVRNVSSCFSERISVIQCALFVCEKLSLSSLSADVPQSLQRSHDRDYGSLAAHRKRKAPPSGHRRAVYLLTSGWRSCAMSAGSTCQEHFHCFQSDEDLDRKAGLPRHQHQHHQWRNLPETVPVQRLHHIQVRTQSKILFTHLKVQWRFWTKIQFS